MSFTNDELDIIRRAYAAHVLAAAGVRNERLEAAFITVPREKFLGPGPWSILSWQQDYVVTPSDDPAYLCADVLVGIEIDTDIRLNNGKPSFHALLIDHANPAAGDHVVHIGAGTGYFTAILAALAGPAGRVTAIEYELDLARRAARNLADCEHVTVVEGDGTTADFDAADVVYVNAGATHPAAIWLDRLKEGGRLILPLTAGKGFGKRGAVFRIGRTGDRYSATWLSGVAIYPCAGARDDAAEAALLRAFEKKGWEFVQSLHRHNDIPAEGCWLWADGWCLSYD
ncbi:MAG: methyltransferase domain-containing protein [Alphaproteobacteria bacterium]|nr:methyltransferase domain-containing protein [Alphaproteobacteria bacterium]